MIENKLILLGFCTKPHGIKGAVTLHLENLNDSILEDGMEVILKPRSVESKIPQEGKGYIIEKISFGNKAICYFKDLSDRNEIEAMIPFDLYVGRDQFPEPEEGEFYITDLIGLDVIDFNTQEKIGKVLRYFDNGAQIVLSMNIKNEIVDLPFVDNFFPEVDIDEKKVFVKIPEVI